MTEAVRRRRMRDVDLLDDRDVLMLAERLQGRPDRETAAMFRISRELVQRRLRRLQQRVPEVPRALARLIRDRRAEGEAVMLSPEDLGQFRTKMRRVRRAASQPVV
jgi:hypothetical protein